MPARRRLLFPLLHAEKGRLPGRIETPSHDALFPTILSLNFYHVILYVNADGCRTVELRESTERPFDVSKLVYLRCVDLQTEKYSPVASFPSLRFVIC